MKITKTFNEKEVLFDITDMSPLEYNAICVALNNLAHSETRNRETLLADKIIRIIEVYENCNPKILNERGVTNGKEETS